MSQKRDMSGVLFKNTRKQKDTHPTHTGQGMIFGREVWISAWVKAGQDGSRFFSLAFKPKDGATQGASNGKPAQQPAPSEFDSEIPF